MHFVSNPVNAIRIINWNQKIRYLSRQIYFPSHKKKAVQTQFASCSLRIICTDSCHHAALNHKIQTWQENLPQLVEPSFPTSFLKDNFNIVDTRYLKLITVPCEAQKIEDLLLAKEFKEVLSRSSFYYDVNLSDNSKHSLPFSGVYFYSFEDVCNQSWSQLKAKEMGGELEEVACIGPKNETKDDGRGKPSEDQLLHIINKLTDSLIHFFDKPHDYTIYHKNIVFQNNLRGITTRGLAAYIQAMYILKIYGFLQYAKVKVDILKITHHVEDGTVRARWRVKYISRQKLLLKFWKLNSMKWSELFQEEAEWLDGFSVFSVGPDGLIYKHMCDKMTPNDDVVINKNSLKSKLMGLFELTPRGTAAGSLNALIPCVRSPEFSRKPT